MATDFQVILEHLPVDIIPNNSSSDPDSEIDNDENSSHDIDSDVSGSDSEYMDVYIIKKQIT